MPIEFPIEVKGVNFEKFDPIKPPLLRREQQGKFVSIRPCADEYEGKTYLGILLGDMTLGLRCSFNEKDSTLTIAGGMANPAIFVPDLCKVIFGCESWWGVIEDPEGLRQITDQDINNVWYVQALKALEETSAQKQRKVDD